MSFFKDVSRDFRRAFKMGARPMDLVFDLSTWIVLSYRMGRALADLPAPIRRALRLAHAPLHGLLETLGGIELPVNAQIGGGLHLRHTHDVVISPDARVGEDCNLSQGVTIGVGGRGERRGVPRLGDRVYVGPGAVLFGAITVGDDAAIGANSVVTRDVPRHSVAAGVPSRVISFAGSAGLVVPAEEEPPDPPAAAQGFLRAA